MKSLRLYAISVMVLTALIVAQPSGLAGAKRPLTVEELKMLASNGVAEQRLLDLVGELGISFAPTPEVLEELSRSGVPASVVKKVASQTPRRPNSVEGTSSEQKTEESASRPKPAGKGPSQRQPAGSAGAALTELPGVDLSGLSAVQRKQVLNRLNAESCPCGCRYTIANCRVKDSACKTSLELANKVVQEVTASGDGEEETEPEGASGGGGFVGKWQGQNGILQLNPDGSAVFNGASVRYTVQGNVLTLIGGGEEAPVPYSLNGDTLSLTIRGQVVTLTRVGGQGGGGQWTGVYINGRPLTSEQVQGIKMIYGVAPLPGRYWYDSRSGLYGYWGREAFGYIRPGHDFGSLPANASAGNTGVFINGRELNMVEVLYLQQMFGAVYRGRWWLDGTTGNFGVEGNPMPLGNLILAIRQAQQQRGGQSGGGGGYRWRDGAGSYGGAEGGCVWMNVPGADTYMSSGCN